METDKKEKILKLDDGIDIVSKSKKEEKQKEKEKEERKFFGGLNFATEMGFMIAIPIAGGALLGSYLDNKFHTTPKLTLSFLFAGIFLAFYNVFRMIKDL